MIIKNETLDTLRATFKALFDRGLGIKTQWDKVATEMPSSSKDNVYGWLGKFPRLRKWVGERAILNMKEKAYRLENEKYEATVGIDAADFEDDNLGIYTPIVEQMGQSANENIDENVFGSLKNGFDAECFDGKPFFSPEHPINSQVDGKGLEGKYSNVIDEANTTGEPWFLLDTSKVIKPLIYQNRKKAELRELFDRNDSRIFEKDEYLFGVDARRAFGYSFPQLAVGCRGELNAENFAKAYKALISMKTDGNVPMAVKPTVLVVGPENRQKAIDILYKEYLAGGESNTNYKIVELVVSPYITATPACTKPVITVDGDKTSSVNVTITAGDGEDIYYTTDGSEPDVESAKYTSTLNFTQIGSVVIKAVAMADGSSNSETARVKITVTK